MAPQLQLIAQPWCQNPSPPLRRALGSAAVLAAARAALALGAALLPLARRENPGRQHVAPHPRRRHAGDGKHHEPGQRRDARENVTHRHQVHHVLRRLRLCHVTAAVQQLALRARATGCAASGQVRAQCGAERRATRLRPVARPRHGAHQAARARDASHATSATQRAGRDCHVSAGRGRTRRPFPRRLASLRVAAAAARTCRRRSWRPATPRRRCAPRAPCGAASAAGTRAAPVQRTRSIQRRAKRSAGGGARRGAHRAGECDHPQPPQLLRILAHALLGGLVGHGAGSAGRRGVRPSRGRAPPARAGLGQPAPRSLRAARLQPRRAAAPCRTTKTSAARKRATSKSSCVSSLLPTPAKRWSTTWRRARHVRAARDAQMRNARSRVTRRAAVALRVLRRVLRRAPRHGRQLRRARCAAARCAS